MSFVLSEANLPATVNCAPMTDDEFMALCEEHPDLSFEMTAEGELIVMAPTFSGSGARNIKVVRYLDIWAEQDGRGMAFESSTGFVLPNGARRSPDASWVLKSRIQEVQAPGTDGFLHLCPDFVIELRSKTDRHKVLQEKMREYLSNGAQLGWLIDPADRSITIYRPDLEPEVRTGLEFIRGEGLMEGFTLPLEAVWNPFGD